MLSKLIELASSKKPSQLAIAVVRTETLKSTRSKHPPSYYWWTIAVGPSHHRMHRQANFP
uniref:Uncharacterized protein n=1 Tax=Picea glauca TaxID=3330 RepID=A0A117NGZ9_PICGL|nr:hypothetical protein ABT39_MTgene5801 [Picea glauca]